MTRRRGALATLTALALVLAGCTAPDATDTADTTRQSAESAVTSGSSDAAGTSAPDPNDVEASVTIRSVGDMLIHNEVYFAAATPGGPQPYDFAPMLDPVAPYLRNADITTANMEVPVAGEAFELSGYPMFNSPPQVIDALKGAGVDIVNNATNHSMDRGLAGLKASISNMRDRGMMYVGSFDSPADRNAPRVIEANGLKVGFLAYTYGTNGIPVPEGEEYAVNLIDQDLMRADIAALKPNVDILIVIMHAGEEYETLPSQYQIDTADAARQAGADFILGGHPHVLEPFARYDGPDPGLGVWWSHGNFLHGQYEDKTKLGGIGEYTITRHKGGELTLDSIRFMPTYTVGRPYTSEFKVIPLADARPLGFIDVDQARADIVQVMNTYTDVEVVDYLD